MGQKGSREGERSYNDDQRSDTTVNSYDPVRSQLKRKIMLESERKAEKAEGQGREKRSPNLRDHFNEHRAEIDALMGRIETLPESKKQQFNEHKVKYQYLQQIFADVFSDPEELVRKATNYPNPHLRAIGRPIRNTNEDRLRDAVNEMRQFHHDLNNQVQETQEARITELQNMIQERHNMYTKIRTMPIPGRRPEWLKWISRLPKEHIKIETQIMNDTLIPQERDHIHRNLHRIEVPKQRTEWLKWINRLPEEYRRNEIQFMNGILIPRERDYMHEHTKKMEVPKQRPEWLKWIDILPENHRAHEIQLMNKALLPRERDYLRERIKTAEREEIMNLRPEVETWLENFSGADREEGTEAMNKLLIEKETSYLPNSTTRMSTEDKKSVWEKYIKTLPEKYRLRMTQYMNVEVLDTSTSHLYF